MKDLQSKKGNGAERKIKKTFKSAVDSVGNEFAEGAICRFYHFKSVYKGRYEYMYKQVISIDDNFIYFKHLPFIEPEKKYNFTLKHDSKELTNVVIVQCHYGDYRNLKRNKRLRD